jgi:lysophospholipase L1-like esterase
MSQHIHTLLCLGDSYTIGEQVPLHESFPYQLVQMLRKEGLHFHAPEIVAQTGWTTFELAEHLIHHQLEEHYDFVTLLIGVNNQYRGLDIDDYKDDFEFLLNKALYFSKNQPSRVCVLSVPDWGVTPFAKGKKAEKIAEEIDAYNAINKTIAEDAQCHYIDITSALRLHAKHKELLAKDGLHYSGKAHEQWAKQLVEWIAKELAK